MSEESLPGARVDIPIVPEMDRAFGYRHDARFVSFRWSWDHFTFDDGRSSGSGNSWAFQSYTRHRAVSSLLSGFDLGGSDHEAACVLLIDREMNRASICPLREARAFLREQYPPEVPMTPEQQAEAAQLFEEMVDKGWREHPVDHAIVAQVMEEQRGRMGRLMSWLDSCPDAEERDR